MHRMLFSHVREKHPTRGRSFLEACDPGIIDLVDEFAEPGMGMSRLLIDAALKRQGRVVRALLIACANLNYQTSTGETALMVAASTGHVEIARALIQAGADVNLAQQDGCTPINIAAERGHVEAILRGRGLYVPALVLPRELEGLSGDRVAQKKY